MEELQIPGARLPMPYPDMKIEKANGTYGRMMLDNYGGRISEMSAVSTYLYSNLILVDDYPEVAKAIREINEVEMHHLAIFGSLAKMLGQDPRLWAYVNNCWQYWSPNFGVFQHSLADIVNASIHSEQMSIDKYQQQISIISDRYLQKMLERIIIDEEHHIFIWQTIYKKYLS